jgi:5'-phosphate synthase pdxT subunit
MVVEPTVGILAFQGDFQKHRELLASMEVDARLVRAASELDGLSALIIPGGESTTIGMLLDRFDLIRPIRERVAAGLPVLGTCAGAILLAEDIEGSNQPKLGVMDITVARNAYGRQIESFEADIELEAFDQPLRGVFIRAPRITRVGRDVEVLARFEGDPVVVRQGRLLAATFHPELSGETRIHTMLRAAVPAASSSTASR